MATRITETDKQRAFEELVKRGFVNIIKPESQANVHQKLIIFQQYLQELTTQDEEPFDIDYHHLSTVISEAMLGATLMLDPASTKDQYALGERMINENMDKLQALITMQ